MSQEPETASNSNDEKKASGIFMVTGLGILSAAAVVGSSGYVAKEIYDTYAADLREIESKIGTPAQPSELAAEALKQKFFKEAVQQAFEKDEPLVIDLADPALRQPLEDSVGATRNQDQRRAQGGKTLVEFAAAGSGVLAVSMIGHYAYKRRKKQQAASNSPNIG